ncbi:MULTISPECIES: cold-shock protein [Agrobacterium]|uniref:cold-shock protein n=1 Tax=Agrobacterium tumefaciens TaxID=358 RepID=UPI0015732913|nr:cold-shock protein [Agrobacterium tumefaciens]
MRKNPYRSGDAIFLKAGVLGANQPKGPGRVVTALPETQQGAVRYRVRFQHENFERNIALDEIDVVASSSRPVEIEGSSSRVAGSSWINSNTIKIKK